MCNHPSTIRNPDAFDRSQIQIECLHCHSVFPFDGIFDWLWTQGCFGKTRITPMDFDGVVERKGHYLIFETKDVGKEIPRGQQITLENLKNPKSFTVLKIWGKSKPEKMVVCPHEGKEKEVTDIEEMKNIVKRWYKWADSVNSEGYIERKINGYKFNGNGGYKDVDPDIDNKGQCMFNAGVFFNQ